MSKTLLVCFLIICVLHPIENANILGLFPWALPSHFAMYRALMIGLAEKGHQVDVYSHFPLKEKINGYNDFRIDLGSASIYTSNVSFELVDVFDDPNIIFTDDGVALCTIFFKTEIAKQLKNSKKKYDLFVTEMFASDCYLGFGHLFKVPTVMATSSVILPWAGDRIGNPDNPAYIPNYFAHFSNDMTLYQRILNTIEIIQLKIGYHYLSTIPSNALAKEFFGADTPDLETLRNNISIILVNSHFSINYARPLVQNFIEVGGLHIKKPTGLTPYYENLLKIGDTFQGVIYLSFGSMLKTETMPNEVLQSIFDSFKEIPYKVIWKANKDDFSKVLDFPDNIYFEKWTPQMDILCHPNVKLFISHGGLMGTQEAIYCGVPRLGIPIFADQVPNIIASELLGIAVRLSWKTITKDTFSKGLKTVLENPKYTIKAKEISKKFKDRPQTPLETAIYWIEYVIRYQGAAHLRSKGADLYWFQYYLLDIIAILLTIIIVAIFIIYKVLSLFKKNIVKIVKRKNE